MKILVCFAMLAVSAIAQNAADTYITRPRVSQIKDASVAAASVRVVLPDGTVVYAQLDATTLILDTSTKPPTLRARSITAVVSEFPKFYQLERNAALQFVLPPGTAYSIYRNGLLMLKGIDYTVTNGLLTFVEGQECCESDELITATVYR